jgi:hypothetical protein
MTSDKDILRKICRMPPSDFLISDAKLGDETDDNPFDSKDEMAEDDWIIVKTDV